MGAQTYQFVVKSGYPLRNTMPPNTTDSHRISADAISGEMEVLRNCAMAVLWNCAACSSVWLRWRSNLVSARMSLPRIVFTSVMRSAITALTPAAKGSNVENAAHWVFAVDALK